MARNCIICGRRAGSREHIFPAALGGRRTNKGIYCGMHNQGFSPLAAVLAVQLRAINALLSVRPDHGDTASAIAVEGPGGMPLELSGSAVTVVPPGPLQAAADGEKRELLFSTEAEAQEWMKRQTEAGYHVKLLSKERRTRYFAEQIHLRLSLGGAEGLRAAGYVALTFFAHHFPDLARTQGLDGFKAYVLATDSGQHVWWECADASGDTPTNPFPFGHTIELAVSTRERRAYARVSLFSALTFAVDLGEVAVDADETIITHIDPLAEHPPNDLVVVRKHSLELKLLKPDNLTTHLGEMIADGTAQKRFARLLADVQAYNLERDMRPLFDKLSAARALPRGEARRIVTEIVGTQGQRILNLMRHVAKGIAAKKSGSPADGYFDAFTMLAAADPSSTSGLTKVAEFALQIVQGIFVDRICQELPDLTLERLSMLLGGGPGAALAGETMMNIILGGDQ